MDSLAHGQDVIVLKPPIITSAQNDPALRLHSAFSLLGASKRASRVAGLDDAEAALFSQTVEGGGVWNSEKGYASLYLKAPGTDLYLPRELAQFEPAIRKIIDHNYKSGETGAVNRDGSEWAHLIVTQRIESPLTENVERDFGIHLDMKPNEVITKGAWFNDERYVVSDTPKMGTIFYDTDTGLTQADLKPCDEDYWDDRLKSVFGSKASTARKFQPYDIAHFNTTTPHARQRPEEPVLRTFLTLGFGHGYVPTGLEQLNNPFLLKAMERQQDLSSFALRSSFGL